MKHDTTTVVVRDDSGQEHTVCSECLNLGHDIVPGSAGQGVCAYVESEAEWAERLARALVYRTQPDGTTLDTETGEVWP